MIEVFTFITRNSADYAELLLKSMETLKSGIEDVQYKCIESVGAERLPIGWECVGKAGQTGHNSNNHAEAMHEALKHITGDIVIFVDADVCILYDMWDFAVTNEMDYVDVWGTAFRDGAKQYQKFPNVFFFCFKKHLKKKLNFYPDIAYGKDSPLRYKITDEKEAALFNKKVGGLIKCDTGWRLPLCLRSVKHNYMPMITCEDPESQLPFTNKDQKQHCLANPNHMAEWHYHDNIFCTHKQASRNHPLYGDDGKIWKKRINKYMRENYGEIL